MNLLFLYAYNVLSRRIKCCIISVVSSVNVFNLTFNYPISTEGDWCFTALESAAVINKSSANAKRPCGSVCCAYVWKDISDIVYNIWCGHIGIGLHSQNTSCRCPGRSRDSGNYRLLNTDGAATRRRKLNYKWINCEFVSRGLTNQSVPRTLPS